MSLKSTKEQLQQLLADEDNKVIALSGKWGTGKSYMWDQVKNSSGNDKVKGALYASLFGLSTIEQIKLKLIQSAVPTMESNPKFWAGSKQLFDSGVKILEGFHKGFSVLNDVGLIFAPAMLREKFIVLDDIERKHEKLNIDEVLGFIDEFTQQHGARFVLILNSDQLDKRHVWETLREKVVDQELRLKTSAAEAFQIAVGLTPSHYADHIFATVEACGLTNIRIIRKVIKAGNRILGDRRDLSSAVLSRVIPSTVFLAAIHYKGIEGGPDFNFILAQGTARYWSHLFDNEEAETEESKKNSKWNLLMNKVGISGCDTFELLVVEFLESGLFDVTKVAEIIDRYVTEADMTSACVACRKFLEESKWNHRLTETELIAQATEVASKSHLMDANMVTSLHKTIMELPEGKLIADAAMMRWIEAFRAKNSEEVELEKFSHWKLHPLIEAEFKRISARIQANTSVLDVCLYMANNRSWSARQEEVLKSATVQDMEAAIRSSSIKDMSLFMFQMLDMCTNKATLYVRFGSAMDNFIQACKNIVEDPVSSRLGKLVKSLFADANLAHLIGPQPEAPAV